MCYFLWDKSYSGDCRVVNHKGTDVLDESDRPLLEKNSESFIRYNKAIAILRKVQKFQEDSFSKLVSARKPFGLATNFSDFSLMENANDKIVLYRFRENGYVSAEKIGRNYDWVDKHKVFVPYASPGSDDYPHLILSKPIVAGKNTACTETYLVVGPFESKSEANNVASYMRTQFFRFMLLLLKNTQHITQKIYRFAPIQDFSIAWSDEKLYEKYNITQEEIDFIDSLIKPLAD